ncbi:hypothetical protein LCGC14_2215360, partial [marine sediment metagenome]
MNGFAKLFQASFTPTIIQNFGTQFEDNSDIVSKSSFNYALLSTFQRLVSPTRYIDPTGVFRNIYRGDLDSSSFSIKPRTQKQEGWASLWIGVQNKPQNLGLVTLNYGTISQFFGKYFSTIQPALYYTERNLQDNIAHVGYGQPLNVPDLLTSEFIGKIDHLNNNFYEILSTKYGDGERLTVTFHQDTSNGIRADSVLSEVLPKEILEKFNNLFEEETNSISIIIQKQGDTIVNGDEFNVFIASISLYLVLFNSLALIQESSGKYGIIASQRELFDADYTFQLGDVELSMTGQQILASDQTGWNRNDEGKIVWNFGDCWPIYLFNDAGELVPWFNSHFLSRGRTISMLRSLQV